MCAALATKDGQLPQFDAKSVIFGFLTSLCQTFDVEASSVPLKYQQIVDELVSSIESRSFRPGDKLPSEADLASRFHSSRSTVIRALREVQERGLIRRRQGSGSFVLDRTVRIAPAHLSFAFLKSTQSGRFADSIVDQIQTQLIAQLQTRGTALIVQTVDDQDDPATDARFVIDHHIRGAFIVPVQGPRAVASTQAMAKLFTNAHHPVVLIDGDFIPAPQRSIFDVVGVEHRHCGYLQTKHLLDTGLQRIVFVGSSPMTPTVEERRLGYLDAMNAAGHDVPDHWMWSVSSTDIDEHFVAEVLRRERPAGIVFKSDEFAALFTRHLPGLGVSVPDQLKVVGFDDRPIASLLPVPLTTIRQPIVEIAESAIMLMDARLKTPGRAACRVLINGELIARESSSPSRTIHEKV